MNRSFSLIFSPFPLIFSSKYARQFGLQEVIVDFYPTGVNHESPHTAFRIYETLVLASATHLDDSLAAGPSARVPAPTLTGEASAGLTYHSLESQPLPALAAAQRLHFVPLVAKGGGWGAYRGAWSRESLLLQRRRVLTGALVARRVASATVQPPPLLPNFGARFVFLRLGSSGGSGSRPFPEFDFSRFPT